MTNVTQVCRDISELTPSAQTACRNFLNQCRQSGLKVRITETYRSQERQDYLYEQGRTRSGKIVTWTHRSRHTSRRAWDICKDVKGEEYTDSNFFAMCGEIAKKLGITWGGTWKQADTPHFEIPENREPKKEDDTIDTEKFKEELDSIKNTLDKLGDRITNLENPMIYNYIDGNMPAWARETVAKLESKGIIRGDENGLGLNYDTLRLLAILDRGRVFDKVI